jgi:hypothetical protein
MKPGDYTVTLEVTDNNQTTYSKSIVINVQSKDDKESEEQIIVLPFNFITLILGSVLAVIVFLSVLFRDKITLSILKYKIKLIEKRKNKYR